MESVTEVEESYQRFMKIKVDPLFGAERSQQIKALATEPSEIEIAPNERQVNRNLALSGVLTGLAIGTIRRHPALRLVACVPLALYMVKAA